MRDLCFLLKYFRIIHSRPSVFPILLKNYYLKKIKRRRILSIVDLAVTYRCQAGCQRCSCRPLFNESSDEIPAKDIISFLSEIKKEGCFFVNITGGEPLMRSDIGDIIDSISKMNFIVSLSTNAMLMNKSLLESFRKKGLNVIQVSLDSFDRREHDARRCLPGNYDKVIETVHKARSLGMNVLINMVATHDLINSDLTALFNFVKKNRCFVSFLLPVPINHDIEDEKDQLTCDDFKKIENFRRLSFVTTDTETSIDGAGCPGGRGRIYFNPYGDIYPCPFIHEKIGNFFLDGLDHILKKAEGLNYSRCIGLKGCDYER